MKKNNLIRRLLLSFLLTGIIYLFYHTLFALLALPFAYFFSCKYLKKEELKTEKMNLNIQFKDMLLSLTAALGAGYSVENALKKASGEMEIIYGSGSEISKELLIMLNQLKMGMNAEEVFSEFAARSKIEDINTFCEIFKVAKRSGGDMAEIMKKTSADISAKVDTRNEIAVLVSAKRLEQNIMLLMPCGIIVYMQFASSGFLSGLYGNAAGVLIMTACLGLYALAWYLGKKVTDINI